MVDITYVLWVQLVNFGLLVIILNSLLLKPVVKHLSERENKISSSQDEAKSNADRAEEMLAEFDRELAEARISSSQIYNKLQAEGVSAQREKMNEAKAKAKELVDKALAEIEAEASKARNILESEMEKLPREIASKLLGRPIS